MLLDGFSLGSGAVEFLIVDVSGDLFGQFVNFNEGDLVGIYSGRELFITYGAGDGNDVALFSAVPEPAAAMLFAMGAIACGLRRRRFS